jgi:hypothetical protein
MSGIEKVKSIARKSEYYQVPRTCFLTTKRHENFYRVAASTDGIACGLKSGATVPVVIDVCPPHVRTFPSAIGRMQVVRIGQIGQRPA